MSDATLLRIAKAAILLRGVFGTDEAFGSWRLVGR